MKILQVVQTILLLIILIILCNYSRGQTIGKEKIFPFNITTRDSVVKGEAKKSVHFRPIQERTYYWFHANKIYTTQGSYEGKVLHGQFTSFYSGGNLRSKGMFNKGVKRGKWILWDKQGVIESTTKWKNGVKTGYYFEYSPVGDRILKAHYSQNRLSGRYIRYDESGSKMILKYKNGKLVIKDPEGKKVDIEERIKSLFKKKSARDEPKEDKKLPGNEKRKKKSDVNKKFT